MRPLKRQRRDVWIVAEGSLLSVLTHTHTHIHTHTDRWGLCCEVAAHPKEPRKTLSQGFLWTTLGVTSRLDSFCANAQRVTFLFLIRTVQ